METLDLGERTKAVVKAQGQELTLCIPTGKQLRDMSKKLKTCKEELGQFEVMKEFFVDLGLTDKFIDDLEMDQLVKLVEYVSGVKKN